ncbi:LLM class flavin-dependent oxidoreductase [Actinosynnema pretiosum]|uniref:LLM class flavin-dependent oxidoreductase n=1 Tax=Actinosynnema pretiosum TaxID=42197 RepID=A0A290ZDK7_9PSEU|nr:LLM class flavin-dependent oxidoreductase [Actinosynnema pretiosum]ATE57086.1 LLM class flavin-dependent oxidoreductase [Actinosynnema pretiosum]
MGTELRLAVALDGTGWHPDGGDGQDGGQGGGQGGGPDPRPLSARHWTGLVLEAERGGIDLVTFEDTLGHRANQLDSLLVAARVAPLTSRIGLVPTAITTHTEPFHLSKAVATLDHVSLGRAGVRLRVDGDPATARHFGRRDLPPLPRSGRPDDAVVADLFAEARDYAEVLRRLWDSWEDDAEIRDVATGRFVDRDKLHHIDFRGGHFAVKGPSITPRPPQGNPPIAVLAHDAERPHRLARESADLVFTTPRDAADVRRTGAEIGRARHFADVVVAFHDDRDLTSDALVHTGGPAELADLAQEWHEAGAFGLRLRPARLPRDLAAITGELVPELRRRGLVPAEPRPATTLRGLLDLPRPANRYAAPRGA